MLRHPSLVILGRPALHVLLALAFAVAFFWPMFAMTRPSATFHFLYLSWLVSLVALFAVSRGRSADAPGGDAGQEGQEGAADRGAVEGEIS
jgi:hypothetical protein